MFVFFKVLVNVAPPKPTRLLTEPERTAMLKHEASPGTPVNPSTLPVTSLGDQPAVHVVCEKETNLGSIPVDVYLNSNNIGWDAATEELLLSLDKQHLFPSLGHNPRLELLDMDSELIQAPLASPEALSAASSMSALSRTGSVPKSDHRSESIKAKLATIKQSPEIFVRNEDSVEDLCEIENEMHVGNSSDKMLSLNESRSVGDFLKKSHLLQTSDINLIAHASQGSLNNLLPSTEYSNSEEALDRDFDRINTQVSQEDNAVKESSPVSTETDGNDSEHKKFKIEQSENGEKDEDEMYERHSPVETTQYGYFDPNELYSAASVGYHPQQSLGGAESAKLHKLSDRHTLSTHPPNKVLQYSQSESRLKGLSESYKMKRSTEEGDIAHLEDTSNVFVHDKTPNKELKPRGSEPALNPKGLSKKSSDGRLYIVKEIENITSENCDTAADNSSLAADDSKTATDITSREKNFKENVSENMSVNNSADLDHTSFFAEDNNSDSENNDKACLLKRIDSDIEERTITEGSRPSSETCHRKDNSSIGRVSTLSSPDEGDTRLFHSNSCHSTFASSTSGESEQRLSLISANSEELPIVETDV